MKQVSVVCRDWSFRLLVVSALAVSLLWPGDTCWNDIDQAIVIDQAFQANAAQQLSASPRVGSTPARPHPFTIWVYQLIFMVTHDFVKIIFIKQFIVILICLWGLYRLSRMLNYNKYFILIFFSSFCHYAISRLQTDESFLIPFSLLLFVFFAWFYKHRGYVPLILLVVSIIAVIHINHRGFITAAPFIAAFFVFEYQWLKRNRLGATLVWGGAFLVCFPYLFGIIQDLYAYGEVLLNGELLPRQYALTKYLFVPVSGGLWYSYDFLQLIPDIYFTRHGVSPVIARTVIGITMAGYLFLVLGMGLTVSGVVKRLRTGESFTLEDRLGILSLLITVLYVGLLFIFQLSHNWLYHSGLWFCNFYFIWRAVTVIQHKKLIKYVFPVYLALMLFFWAGGKAVIHAHSDRLFTIQTATDMAGKIAAYSPESDIVILTGWSDELERIGDFLVDHSDNAILGFFYREAGLSLQEAGRSQWVKNENLLYRTLRPLVYIARQKQSGFSPARTLIIKKDDSPEKRGIILVDDPEQVRLELEKTAAQ